MNAGPPLGWMNERRILALLEATGQVHYRLSADGAVIHHLRGPWIEAEPARPLVGLLDRLPPADRPRVQEAVAEAVRERRPFDIEHRVIRPDGTTGWIRSRAVPLLDGRGEVEEWLGTAEDITACKEAEARQRALLAEAPRQMRNVLAVVRSILRRSARSATNVEDYATHLQGRIDALARARSALMSVPGAGLDLETLLRDELRAAAAGEGQLRLSGAAVRLPDRAAELLALAFHELATNAIKFGALGPAGGTVAVDWTVEEGETARLRLCWAERPARPALPPGPPGFGSELIERMLPYSLGATTRIGHGPDGFRCEIGLPLGAAGA